VGCEGGKVGPRADEETDQDDPKKKVIEFEARDLIVGFNWANLFKVDRTVALGVFFL
jgi:hypothetical protein